MQAAPSSPIHRRTFLKGSTAVAAGIAIATPFHALLARADQGHDHQGRGRDRGRSPDYGPLAAVKDHTTGLPLLMLPAGHRRAERRAQRHHRRFPWQRVRRRHLQPRREVAVLQHPDPWDHVRSHRPLA